MNSSYAESGHISICKDTTRNTQKGSQTFTVQAAMRYVENLAIHQASTAIDDTIGRTNSPTEIHVAKLKGKWFIIHQNANGYTRCHCQRSSKKPHDCLSEAFPLDAHVLETLATHCLPPVDSQVLHCYTEYHPKSGGQLYRAHPNYQDKPWLDHVLVSWKDKRGNTRLYPNCIHSSTCTMFCHIPSSISPLTTSQNPVSTLSSNPMVLSKFPVLVRGRG
jgi:hypothetical protein